MVGNSRSESGEAKDEIKLPISTSAAEAAASSSSSARKQPHHLWTTMNEDLLIEILQKLDIEVIVRFGIMCKAWGKACKNPALWRVLDLKNEEKSDEKQDLKFELMCECAVDRSKGQLIDLSIANHGENELLGYITDRARRLRRLKLLNYDIIGSVLIEALKKLPELVELHLIMMNPLHGNEIEAIGTSCPLLESFTYNKHYELLDEDAVPYNPSNRAFAIARTMPNLRHLSLFADPMKNEGLEAILDCCPHLESLDLRHCSGLDLEQGGLGKRLLERVKEVRLPSDSTSDIEWPFTFSDNESKTSSPPCGSDEDLDEDLDEEYA